MRTIEEIEKAKDMLVEKLYSFDDSKELTNLELDCILVAYAKFQALYWVLGKMENL